MIPTKVAQAPPIYPIMLIILLALLLNGLGVISGIKATAGFRYIIAKKTTIAIKEIVPTKLWIWNKTGIKGKAIAQQKVPIKI